MSMKTILVPLEESEGLSSVLVCAVLVSKRFNSYIEGLHIRPLPAEVLAVAGEGLYAGTSDLLGILEQRDSDRSKRTSKQFVELMSDYGISLSNGETAQTGPTAKWLEETMPGDEVVGNKGRSFDLVVVGLPIRGAVTPSRSRLESAIFDSGRLTLIAPPQSPTTLGESIIIAWNRSTETARTVALSMPFLQQANKVIVLSVEGYGVTGPSSAEVTQNLIRNNIPAQEKKISRGDRTIAQAILEETMSNGGDLLIKGAYTHSRLRQMIFGGVTNEILTTSALPILMAH